MQRRVDASETIAPLANSIRRVQRAPVVGAEGGDLDDDTGRRIAAARSGGSPLPSTVRAPMESALGADLGAIRVHEGPSARDLSDRIQAKAFTVGRDVFFRDGLPDVRGREGQHLIAHELAHTIQQGAAGAVQRKIVGWTEWKTASDRTRMLSSKPKKRSSQLQAVDWWLYTYEQQCGRPEHDFGVAAITELSTAIAAWRASKAKKRSKKPSIREANIAALEVSVAAELLEVAEMRTIRDRLRATYGIELDNQAGEDAIRRSYGAGGPYAGSAPAAADVLDDLKQTGWSVQDLRLIEEALAVYAPILGGQRDVGTLGAQTITSFSSLEADITGDKQAIEGTRGTRQSTFGETFTKTAPQLPGVGGPASKLANVAMFGYAHNVKDFVPGRDMANATPENLAKGYRGTIIHELSHGLIEMLPAPPIPAAPPIGHTGPYVQPPMARNMLEFFAQETAYWSTTSLESGTPGAEAPITGYGGTNAAEDLGETLMFFVEDPAKLNADCPLRFAFVRKYLKDYVSPTHIAAAETAAGLPPGGVAPASAAAPGAAAPGSGDLTDAITKAKAGLKPVPDRPADGAVLTAQALTMALAKITGNRPAPQFLLGSEVDEEWEDDGEMAEAASGDVS